jgi:uracil-DNA glycosylase
MKNQRVEYTMPSTQSGRSDMAVVAEAPGLWELIGREGLSGPSGGIINTLFKRARIDRSVCLIANVFRLRPLKNDEMQFFLTRSKAKLLGIPFEGPTLVLPGVETSIELGIYEDSTGTERRLYPRLVEEIRALASALQRTQPRAILALGATALWALTGRNSITTHCVAREPLPCLLYPGAQVIACFHPRSLISDQKRILLAYRSILLFRKEASR